MASSQIIPTRMELSRIKDKLAVARKGHKLLKDKRDELMRQFLIMVRENMELRKHVEEGIRQANINFIVAKAGMDAETLNTALMAAKQKVTLGVSTKNVMSVNIPVFDVRTKTASETDIYSYGYAFTSSDDMILLAEKEKACKLMAAEIEKTRRRVNALEHVIIPEAQKNIKYISMKLEETARDNTIRLIKVKDMVLEDAHRYSERK